MRSTTPSSRSGVSQSDISFWLTPERWGAVEGQAYLDHAATTPLRPGVLDAMLPLLADGFGNPSGAHARARAARVAVDDARESLAADLGCQPGEVVFTSGGTEADNAAVFGGGVRTGEGPNPARVVCSAVEHHAVLLPVERVGGDVVAVDATGAIDLAALAEVLDDDVRLVSVLLVNNEVGTIADLSAVGAVVADRAPHAVLHTDAVQALAWIDLAQTAAPAALVSVSAHKFGGPTGVGALVVRDGTAFEPRQLGGGQERDRRSGSLNVAGIVGMAVAARLAVAERDATVARVGALRDRLVDGLLAVVPGAFDSTDRRRAVAGCANVCFDDIESEALLFLLEVGGVLASAASSCASGAQDPSHVLAAMGVPRARAAGSLRLSLGATTTDADIDRALAVIPPAVDRLRRVGS